MSVPATPVAKLKTLFQQLAVGFALFPPTAVDGRWLWLTLLWVAVVLTVVSGAHYLLRARRVATEQLAPVRPNGDGLWAGRVGLVRIGRR